MPMRNRSTTHSVFLALTVTLLCGPLGLTAQEEVAPTGNAVVLTGAMVPYRFGSSDGLFNLGSALALVQLLPPGIYVAMNGHYFAWNSVTKNREIGAFEEKCSPTKPSVRRRCPRRA